MKNIKYSIIFEFRTYIDDEFPDFATELNFVPVVGMNFYITNESHLFPESMKEGRWFKVEDVDYLLKEDVFVVSLKDASEYVFKEDE
jgi:hypothetical protein